MNVLYLVEKTKGSGFEFGSGLGVRIRVRVGVGVGVRVRVVRCLGIVKYNTKEQSTLLVIKVRMRLWSRLE